MQRWRRPARQFRQVPQTMCPSPETMSPTSTSRTPAPTATTAPTNSWPMISGALTAAAAHESHDSMCRSVPQMPARITLILTSPGPASGSGRSASTKPGPAAAL